MGKHLVQPLFQRKLGYRILFLLAVDGPQTILDFHEKLGIRYPSTQVYNWIYKYHSLIKTTQTERRFKRGTKPFLYTLRPKGFVYLLYLNKLFERSTLDVGEFNNCHIIVL